MNRPPSPAEQARLDNLMRQHKVANSWIIAELLSENVQPEGLHEGLVRRVREHVEQDPNRLYRLSEVFRSQLGDESLYQRLADLRNLDNGPADLAALKAISPLGAVWLAVETAMAQVNALPIERLVTLAEAFLQDDQAVVIEEQPPMQFGSVDMNDDQFISVLAELKLHDIELGVGVSHANFMDLLLVGLRTHRRVMEKARQERQRQPSPPTARQQQPEKRFKKLPT